MNKTLDGLTEFFASYRKVCVAYTCGIENPVLTRAALEAGCDVVAMIAVTSMVRRADAEYMQRILDSIYREICNGYRAYMNMKLAPKRSIGTFTCVPLEVDVLKMTGVIANSDNRCYHCKKCALRHIAYLAQKLMCDVVVDSTYSADQHQTRATDGLGILNPLHLIPYRQITQDLANEGLYGRFYDKWCLADGYCENASLSAEKLALAENIGEVLSDFGLGGVRFKVHDGLMRIKGRRGDLKRLAEADFDSLNRQLIECGFEYVTMDLDEAM